MSNKLDKLKKILEKARQINGDVSLAKELIELEEKINGKEVIEVKVVHELRGKDGKDGEDYKLTDKDKKEIADSITVPVVEKVIEKVETIIEQPIINSETIEVENDETGEEIVEKINDLSVQDDKYKIDASHIKNLPIGKGGGGSTARNFYQLFDTPENYAGAGGYKVKVKSDESGLEFLADSGGSAWGSITGTLSDQTDLQSALDAKQNTITTGTTAQYFRGDLSLATFPTNVSSFTNDAGYLTSSTGVTSVSGTADRITIGGTATAPIVDIASTYVGQASITTLGTITTGVWNGTAIANANLANSSLTIGSTNIALGATSLTLAGLTSVTSTTFVGALTGNASTATALATARTIGTVTGDATSAGSSFDGTANNTNALTLATVNADVGSFGSSTSIPSFTVNAKGLITATSGNAVIAPAGTLTGTTLASNVVTSSLTSVGTLGTLTVTAAPTFSAMTAGSVLFAGIAGLLSQDNANFFWEDTNNYLQIGGALTGATADANTLHVGAKTANSFVTLNFQNKSNGAAASTDAILYNDSGTNSANYLDIGINSSGYTGSSILNGAGDAYIYNVSEDIVIGTATAGKNVVIFTGGTGGTAASKTRATFTDTGLQMMNGSAAAPSLSGTGATTTGFYWAATPSILVSIAGVNRGTWTAGTLSINSSNGGAVDIGGASQYMDMSGTIVAGAATFQGLRTTNLIWDMQVNRTNSFGLNNANTIGGSTGSLTLTTMTGARSGNVTTGTIGVAITTSNAFEAREFNNGSGGTVTVANNFGFNASQNMTTGTAINAAFSGNNTANATRWNLYMSTTAQNWLAGNLGLGSGLSAPAAKLHIAAGSASASTAPLKFNSGPLMTVAEAGAVEFLTDKFYGTITTGAVRHTFVTLESTAQTFTNDVSVPDEVYGAGWNGSLEVPTKNALYDKIETLGGGADYKYYVLVGGYN